MYYIGINVDDPNKLQYYCRNCNYTDDSICTDGGCILNTQSNGIDKKYNHIVNKYTKQDPTLPRMYNMNCPNSLCESNKESVQNKPEIVYFRYDDNNLRYLYICTVCDTTWKTNEK
jgi:hypothetical protein